MLPNRIVRCFSPLLFLLAMSCATAELATYPPSDGRPRHDYIAFGEKAMITSAHPLASEAGLAMLRKGGNAVDAAVAVSFAISVLRPQSTGIGGGGFLLYYDRKEQQTNAYDFRERAPAKAQRDMFLDAKGRPRDYIYHGVRIPHASVNGHLSAGVPGLVAGLTTVHGKYGTLPLAEVMAPAIKIAEEGFTVYPALANAIRERMSVLKNFRASQKIFLPGHRPLAAGELLVQKDLAHTLRLIADKGKAGFYKGEVAAKFVAEMQKGGIITQTDLDSYRVKQRPALTTNYRGYKVVAMPPPSSGGIHIVQILNMLSQDNLKSLGHNSPAGVHLLAEAMRRAYADRAKYLGDPDFVDVPTAGLTSARYALSLREKINPAQATPSKTLQAGTPMPPESPSTTHISVVDQHGNAVSTTQTINYTFGSGVVVEGTGVVLNDEMDDFSIKPGEPNAYGLVGNGANAIQARKTMLSSMSPTLVFNPNEQLELVVGSPGGSLIITATLQAILNYIDHRLALPDAVHAYRIHNQWLPDEIRIEPRALPEPTVAELTAMGHRININEKPMGDVQAIARHAKGWIGVSDTRSDGKPLGF